MKFKLILLSIFPLIINTVSAASFNCTKAKKTVEFSICNNSSLNDADTELGNVYRELRHSLSDEESLMLRDEQRLWIRQRDEACSPSDIVCLNYEVTLRTQELKRKLDIKKYAESSIPEYQPSYIGRSCSTEMPSLACSPENRKDKAFAMCAMVMGGCEVVTNQLEEMGQRYAAGQVCNAMTSELSGQQYDVNAMLNSFVTDSLSEGARSALKSDNPFVQFFVGLPLAATSLVIKAQQFDQCVSQASQNCSRLYNEWKSNCQDRAVRNEPHGIHPYV